MPLRLQAAWSPPSPLDDNAYTGTTPTYVTGSGTSVSELAASRISTVAACVKLITESQAQLPLILYDRFLDASGQDAKRRATGPLARRIRLEPADGITHFDFIQSMSTTGLMRPWAYAEKIYDGLDVQLKPLDPDRVRVDRLKVGPNAGQKRYGYREDDSTWRPILAEDMFALKGDDILSKARDSLGLSQSVLRASANQWRNGLNLQGFLATDPGVTYDDDDYDRIRKQLTLRGTGEGAGGFAILPEALRWNLMGMNNEQAELVAYSNWTVLDIARYFGVPPYKLGITDPGAMSRASIEAQSIEIIIFTLMPKIRRWEETFALNLLDDDRQFVEFLLAGLARGTLTERYAAYAVARQWGWLSVNDIRRLENMDSIPGGDSYLSPLNMTPVALEQGSPVAELASMLANDAAGNIIRREIGAIGKAAEKHGPESEAFQQSAREFYAAHGGYVAEKLHVPTAEAQSYAASQLARLLAGGPSVMADWEKRIPELAGMALERYEPAAASSVIAAQMAEIVELRARPVSLPPVEVEGERVERGLRALTAFTDAMSPTFHSTVNVEPTPLTVNVAAPLVTVEAAAAPVVNVAAPEPTVVNVAAPIVNVAAAEPADPSIPQHMIIDRMPPPAKVTATVKRDRDKQVSTVDIS